MISLVQTDGMLDGECQQSAWNTVGLCSVGISKLAFFHNSVAGCHTDTIRIIMVKIVLCHGISATVSDLRRKSNLGFPIDFVFIYKNVTFSVTV